MSTFPNIFDRAKAYEDGKNGEIRPSTNIVINTNRLWYSKIQQSVHSLQLHMTSMVTK